jgi:hypothetical protein
LEAAAQKSRAKRRIHLEKKEIAEAQIEALQGEAVAKRLAEKRRQHQGLVVRAPLQGRVMARNLELKRDTFLAEGDELLTVADERRKELQIAIPQEDMESVMRAVGDEVVVRLPSRGRFVGRLNRVCPRAVTAPLHPGLCAANGGPLAVVPVAEKPVANDVHTPCRLTEPHFTGYVELPPDCRELASGELGVAFVSSSPKSLAQELIDRLCRAIQKRMATLSRPHP